jgi:hypothetical protein
MVGDGGFEPPYAKQTGLQPVPFGHSGNPPKNLGRYLKNTLAEEELTVGLEPATCCLQNSCSAN